MLLPYKKRINSKAVYKPMLDEKDLQQYDRQLDRGFKQLRFAKELEQEFRSFLFARNLVKQRGAILLGIFFLLTLTPIDLSFLDGKAREFYLISRIWIPIPLLVLALIGTKFQNLQRYFSLASFFIITFIGITTNIVSVYTLQQGQYLPYEGNLLIIIVAFFLGGMRFKQALTCVIIIISIYIFLSEFYIPNNIHQMHHYYFLIATTLIGGVSAYTLEYQVRLSFLQRGALRNLAKTDTLTGLYNRGAINQKLNRLVEYAYRENKPLTLLLLDVDHFKGFNDRYGHIQGDQCLQALARELIANCKRPLDFAGRYGGEEFIILWFDALPNEADTFAKRVKSAIDRLNIPHSDSETSSHVTVSGGMVCGIPTSINQSTDMLQQADQCLYRAKESGRNRIIIQDFGEENSITAIVK